MVKERAVVLNTEFYKIVSDLVDRLETRKLLTHEWKVFTRYKKRFIKLPQPVNPERPDDHSEDQRDFIGTFTFSGEPVLGRVQLKYEAKTEIKPEILAELIQAICDWAFAQDDVYSVQFDTNDASLKEELFKISFKNEDGKLILRRESDLYLISFAVIGLVLGISFGGCFQTSGLISGMIIGAVTGLLIGTGRDKREKVHRQLVEKENYREE